MSVASHLGIDLREYDARIRTFIPRYDEMIGGAAAAVAAAGRPRTVVDLGIGTGALAAACVSALPTLRVIGIDGDAGILLMARERLGARLTAMEGDFTKVDLPPCDAMTASLSLHHIRPAAAKQRFYRQVRRALRPGGALVIADCFLPSSERLKRAAFAEWHAHLARTYTPAEVRGYFRAWRREDTYLPLADEIRMLTRAGFTVDVPWRHGTFAVIAAIR